MRVSLTINGEPAEYEIAPADTLLAVLRGPASLTAAKQACGRGECGACTVLVGGRPLMACVTLAARVTGPVETAEGLAAEATRLRESFADHGAFQCGFCTPGQLVRAAAALRAGLPETDAELRREISGNLCRCTGYQAIVAAIRAAAAAGHEREERRERQEPAERQEREENT